MADNVPITAGSGTNIATDDIASVQYQRVKIIHGADGVNDGDVCLTDPLPIQPICNIVTVQTDVTLPTSSVYLANDCMSDSTSAPTSGGYTFTGAARTSGGSGIIVDACFSTSADQSTKMSAECWIFNTSVTNINDNSPFVVSDNEIKTCIGVIPFTMIDAGNNGFAQATGLNIMFTCSGSANLRFLYRVRNAYTPATDVITATLKIIQLN